MPIDYDELPKKWEPLVRRMAGIAGRECGQKGFAIMSVEILVDTRGEPAFFTEPKLTKLETRLNASDFLSKILQMLGQNKNANDVVDKPKVSC